MWRYRYKRGYPRRRYNYRELHIGLQDEKLTLKDRAIIFLIFYVLLSIPVGLSLLVIALIKSFH